MKASEKFWFGILGMILLIMNIVWPDTIIVTIFIYVIISLGYLVFSESLEVEYTFNKYNVLYMLWKLIQHFNKFIDERF